MLLAELLLVFDIASKESENAFQNALGTTAKRERVWHNIWDDGIRM